MKFDLNRILGIATLVGGLVKTTQEKLKGKSGSEKKDVVLEQVKFLLPVVEGITEKDIADDVLWLEAVSELIAAEKAVQKARARVTALVADIKAR